MPTATTDIVVLTPAESAARDAYFENWNTPAKIAARAARHTEVVARATEGGYSPYWHRNGSGNGCPFEARLAEDALTVTWLASADSETVIDGQVAIPVRALDTVHDLPVIDDGDLLAALPTFTNPGDLTAVAVVREQHSTLTAIRRDVQHVARKIIIDAGKTLDGMDRVAVLDLGEIVREQLTTSGWRPENPIRWLHGLTPDQLSATAVR